MQRITRSFAIILFLTILNNCQYIQIVQPEDISVKLRQPDYGLCEEERINPETLRNLQSGQGVGAKSYRKVLEANRECIRELGLVGKHNEEAARSLEKQAEDSFWNGVSWGAAGLAILEVIIFVGIYF